MDETERRLAALERGVAERLGDLDQRMAAIERGLAALDERSDAAPVGLAYAIAAIINGLNRAGQKFRAELMSDLRARRDYLADQDIAPEAAQEIDRILSLVEQGGPRRDPADRPPPSPPPGSG